MNAGAQRMQELLTVAGKYFIIPVYQRPYSWEIEQCKQLWKDIWDIGKRKNGNHFTGSIVWIQESSPAVGSTPVLIIDGQQRMTTVTLLLIALAEYARNYEQELLYNPNLLDFSYDEIIDDRYLIDKHKKRDDGYYRLTLSENDCAILRNLEDHLVDPAHTSDVQANSRLIENLNFFRHCLSECTMKDVNVVWAGVQRLQIVSISLTQGVDDPQLIFESMNSTGKDLSAADLVRNYVLMRQPSEEQAVLYRKHWRNIEMNLGDTYDQVFDEFLYAYLTVRNTTSKPLMRRDMYSQFKKYAADRGYLENADTTKELLQEMERFSDYYARITRGTEKDPALNQRLWRLRQLQVAALNPLILSFYEDYDAQAFSYDDFIALLNTLESYAFRRAVCDCPSREYPKLVVSLINRLNRVQDKGGNYLEAFQAFLLTTTVENQRFPDDTEFQEALRSRDVYSFQRSFYMFSRLESSYHTKGLMSDPRDFTKKNDKGQPMYTIEHLMPQNAMQHAEWRKMLGDNAEDKFEKNVHNLGNLSLTPYNSELSDKTLQAKQQLLQVQNVDLKLNEDFMKATIWDEKSISDRSRKLAKRAVQVWQRPSLPSEVLDTFKTAKKTTRKKAIKVTIADLACVGLKVGDVLRSKKGAGSATVTRTYKLRLENDQEFVMPTQAADENQKLHGLPKSADGWHYWILPNPNPNEDSLDTLRQKFIALSASDEQKQTHENYWSEFKEICVNDADFVDIFGDPSNKKPHVEWDGILSTFDFRFGTPMYALIAALILGEDGQYQQVEVRISCMPKAYAEVYAKKSIYEDMMREEGGSVQADSLDGGANPDGRKYLRLVYPVTQAQAEDDTAVCECQKQILRRAYATLKPLLEPIL